MALTFGSLFAGIGGFDLGLERAGMVCKWQVEIDPFCRAVLAKHWPEVRRYEDVRTVGAELDRVDVICGGFPCQDISNAGRGVGLAGERSGLWFEYLRLIRELRPSYVIVENVAALLARGMGTVLGDLAASGYDAEWDCLPAAAFGAPHRRDRAWIVAYPSGVGRTYADEHFRCKPTNKAGESHARSRLLDAAAGVYPKILTVAVGAVADPWRVEPNVGRVAHGVSARVDRLRGLGNAVVPQIAEWLGRRILEAETAVTPASPPGGRSA